MNNISIAFLISFLYFSIISLNLSAQTVIEMTYPTDADLVLVKVDNKKDADIIVYKTTDKEEAKQWDCMWLFKEWGFSDISVFLMNSISDTLLYIEDDYAYKVAGKIYFTDKKEERGYNDPYFRLEGVFRKFRDAKTDTVQTIAINNIPKEYYMNIKGKLSFNQTKSIPENLKIKLLDSNVVNTIFEFKPDSCDFSYKHKVNKGYYNLMVTATGYMPYTDQVYISENDTAYTSRLILNMEPDKPKVESILFVNNILFEFDSYVLKPESKDLLDKISEVLKKNPNIKMEITGYTDNKGDKSYNLRLSKMRANSALNFLMSKGISADRLTAVGKGIDDPIALNNRGNGNDCLPCRKYNRRVELKFENDEGLIKIESIQVPQNMRIRDNSK
jgi:outer membrane protein OmpA-like peptidoglycan-associated protein